MAEALRKVDSAVASRSSKIGTMKALRIHGKEDLRLEDIQTPQCGDGQIMIKPAWCGICGTGELGKALRRLKTDTGNSRPSRVHGRPVIMSNNSASNNQ
jgi:hypothetical protein